MIRNRLFYFLLALLPVSTAYISSENDLGFGKWDSPILTYKIHQYPTSLRHPRLLPLMMRRHVDSCMEKATKLWTPATGVRFQKVNHDDADIKVSFYSSDHGDSYPFDGKGGEVGHTFYPDEFRRGNIHLDDDEPWAPDGRNLEWTLAHELGHALGIPHQPGPSLMEFGYRGHSKTVLTNIDTEAAAKIYKI